MTKRAHRTLNIGCDLDGVWYAFVDALRQFIHLTTGRPLATMPDPTTWDFYADDWHMPLTEFVAHCNAGVDAGFLFRVGAPMGAVAAGTARLLEAGHRVHIITDRSRTGLPGKAQENTLGWLTENAIGYTTLTFSADKRVVPCDVFIEDRPKNFLELRDAGVDAYLRDQPYNAHLDTPPGRRVPTFEAFVDAVLQAA